MHYKNLLSIGELANICNISHKTLRHYDSINLLKPIEVNAENGYRYYSKWQISRVITIKELQSLGISLAEIKMCLENSNSNLLIENLKEIFKTKEMEIKEQIFTLHKNLENIKAYKCQYEKIEKILMIEEESKVIVKKIHERKMIYKEYNGKYDAEVFRLYYKEFIESFREKGYVSSNGPIFPMAIYSEVSDLSNIKIGFEVDKEEYCNDFIVTQIPEAYYVSYIHKGSYFSLRNEAYKNVYKFIQENGYEVAGLSIEIYYISENIMVEQDYFITEIQIQVKKL